jgi:hypothetical protein
MSLPRDDRDREIEAGTNDMAYGPAESWPAWTDLSTWEVGPEPLLPSDEDIEAWEKEEGHRRWLDHLAEGF